MVSEGSGNHQKPVVFTTRLWPNFLWHMLALGKIGYDSDYADRFEHTVDRGDLELLKSYREELVFGAGKGGTLSAFFGTFAGALDLDSKFDLEHYFLVLQECFDDGRLGRFVDVYPEVFGTDRFFQRGLLNADLPEDREVFKRAIGQLSGIYRRSFGPYVEEVWPLANEALKPRSHVLAEHFSGRDYIAQWERFLAVEWDGLRYEIVLCFSNRNGPDYNSLGYNANLIYYDKPFDRTCQFLSHEIGTHLLIDLYMDLAESGQYDTTELYAAYECLAMFYNRIILGVPALAYDIPQFDSDRRLSEYESVFEEGMTPNDLINRVLAH